MCSTWSGHGGWLAAHEASDRAPFKRPLSLTGGPRIFLFIKIFKHPHFDIRIGDLIDV
jgi:hypothetical protein